MQRLSFTYPLVVTILSNIDELFPGISRSVGIYYDSVSQSIKGVEAKRGSVDLNDLNLNVSDKIINEERNNKTPYSWISADEVFFNIKTDIIKEKELFDEYDNHILVIRLYNSDDDMYDLMFFFFRKDLGLFKVSNSEELLTTTNKTIINRLVYHNIKMMQKIREEDKKVYARISESNRHNVSNYRELQMDYKAKQDNYSQSIIEYCKNHLRKISNSEDIDIQLSDSAIEKLSGYNNKFEYLENTIENAAIVAYNRSYGLSNEHIVITETDIVFYEIAEDKAEVEVLERPVYSIYSKTEGFLDKYELSAQKVLNKNLPLNGKIVGKNCEPPVSAAAISDSLRNHQKKIRTLFAKYPDRWPIIRGNFRPVINIASVRQANINLESREQDENAKSS